MKQLCLKNDEIVPSYPGLPYCSCYQYKTRFVRRKHSLCADSNQFSSRVCTQAAETWLGEMRKGLSRRRICHPPLFVFFLEKYSLILCLNVFELLADF